jgi:hypothetical protein
MRFSGVRDSPSSTSALGFAAFTSPANAPRRGELLPRRGDPPRSDDTDAVSVTSHITFKRTHTQPAAAAPSAAANPSQPKPKHVVITLATARRHGAAGRGGHGRSRLAHGSTHLPAHTGKHNGSGCTATPAVNERRTATAPANTGSMRTALLRGEFNHGRTIAGNRNASHRDVTPSRLPHIHRHGRLRTTRAC